MAESKSVAIVILNWNGTGLLEKFLPSVIQNSLKENVKIIIADNGSTDGSIDFLKKKFPDTCVIDLKENHGFAKGYNLALNEIDADYFVLLNSDIEVTPGWLHSGIARLDSDPAIAAVQPKVLSFYSKKQFEYAGAAGGFLDWLGYPFCRGRILNVNETDSGQYDTPTPIFWATGACMFIKKSCFVAAGGFDIDFWAHMEEIDLCWRLKNHGYSVWYEPSSIVYHLGGGTLPYNDPKKLYLNFRNNLWVLYKNLPGDKLCYRLIIRMILDFIASFKLLSELNLTGFLSVFRAHFDFYRTIGKFHKKRKNIFRTVSATHHKEIYRGSILWDFYFNRKNKFSALNFLK